MPREGDDVIELGDFAAVGARAAVASRDWKTLKTLPPDATRGAAAAVVG